MNRVVALIFALVVLVGAGFLVREFMREAPVPGETPSPIVSVPATPDGAPPVIEAPPFQEAARPDFAFRRLEIDTSKEAPEACLVFTRALDASGKVRYEDFLAFDPAIAIAVRPTDDRLCVAGLTFNTDYTLTMRAGLPAASGETLAQAETIPVALRDQRPQIAFGNGFILPREAGGGVPITTVNVDEIKVRVVRVGDRLLSQLETDIIEQREIYSYETNEFINETGALVWEGSLKITGPRNQAITTSFPLSDVMPANAPGAYLIVAENAAGTSNDEYDWGAKSAQWVINTDLGLTTFRGGAGLNVFVRSFQSAAPLAGVKLTLVARNNEILGVATTNSEGRADFPAGLLRGTGGNEPVVVMAYGTQDDFAYLDLRRPAFDLTDRGVDGRPAPGPVDAYLYLERGIYRPGETVQLTGLLRDGSARALADMPLTVIVRRPDGSEFRRFSVTDQMQGGFSLPVTLTATAPRGRWQAAVHSDPAAAPVARIAFDVQDFVPQRLKLTLTPAQARLAPGGNIDVGLEARFLYGAPAAGLTGEGEVSIIRDSNPFPALKGFRFGRVGDTFDTVLVPVTVPATDAAGKAQAAGFVPQLPETSLPLKARIRLSLFEPGGRTTDDIVEMPVTTRDVMLGIRPMFEDDSVREGSEAAFELVAVGPDGAQVARGGITYELVREDYGYNWYQTESGEWRYQEVRRDRIVTGGTLDLAAAAPTRFGHVVQWGSYRLTVSDPASGATSSMRFWGGWGAGVTSDRPDRVAVITDKPSYKAGETARIEIRAPSDGKALVAIATDRIVSSRLVDVSASGTTVDLAVDGDWGGGAYVLVTHYRPLSSAVSRAPVRAIGVAWVGIDNSDRILSVALDAPETIAPRQTLNVGVTVANATGETFVTLAAVDEGILQLTDFKSPTPVDWYFGKRQLGLDIRDDYGRLILSQAQVGAERSGGDGFGGRGLAVVPTRTVALYSGLVKLDAAGKATIPLEVPDFNGELRLMAVAFGPATVGEFSRPMTVRDAVVGEVVLPRFLAPGDRPQVGLNLHNVAGAPGTYTATVTASGPLAVAGGELTLTQELAVGDRRLLPVSFETSGSGIATVTLTLSGPGGYTVTRAWPIEVRPPQLPVTRETVAEFKPGEEMMLTRDLLNGFVPGTEALTVTLAGAKGFDNVPGMLRWLDRYPYGCLEQTTSRAFPLVFFNDMAQLAGLKTDAELAERVQVAIDRVLDMQTWSGGFGLWTGSTSETDVWLSAFTTDFLVQAQAKGYVVPREGLERAYRYLARVAASDSTDDKSRAYAYYLLARAGQVNASDLRYFADTRGANVASAMGAGMVGVALLQVGDKARARAAFDRARVLGVERPLQSFVPYSYYDTQLRDVSGLIAMAAEGDERPLLPPLVERVSAFNTQVQWTTTQEKAWMLIAAHAIEANAPQIQIDVRGMTPADPAARVLRLAPAPDELATGVTLRNAGNATAWRTISAEGVPQDLLPAEARGGLTVSKRFFTLDGTEVTPGTMAQNDRLIVLVEGSAADNTFRQMAVLDLLPAGWQIEAPVGRNDDGSTLYGFLPTLTPTDIQEARDDRYVAAFTIGDRFRDPRRASYQPQFSLAYIVRATTPGTFILPAAFAEDMYAPQVQARTAPGSLTVTAAN